MRFILAGNPNSGKTTLFNRLTKSNAKVGNWAGVTVESRVGFYKDNQENIEIIDLPGIYSLSPHKEDELIARKAIVANGVDAIINVADATNLERSLMLTTQLMELSVPVILALNMIDEIKEDGSALDTELISRELGIPVVCICAKAGEGLEQLIQTTKKQLFDIKPKSILLRTEMADAIQSIRSLLFKISCRNDLFTTVKLMESDKIIQKELYLAPSLANDIYTVLESMGENVVDRIVAHRHSFIQALMQSAFKKGHQSVQENQTEKADSFLLHKYFALPLFFLIMFVIFQITFGFVGSTLSDWIDIAFSEIINPWVATVLANMDVSERIVSLVVDGILAGIGSVLTFMPQVVLLFLLLSLLDDIGYTARTAFIMEALFNKIGLTGQSFIPMLMGFGCSVPAIMSARSLQSEKDRRLTIMMIPFMSCSARLPVYGVFAAALFAKGGGTVVFSLYMLGIIVSLLIALLLNRTLFRSQNNTTVFELPKYRHASLRSIMFRVLNKSKDFLIRAGTIMFTASVVIWFFQSFDIYFELVQDNANSMFADVGRILAPLFAPLGFGNWQASVALLTGIIAKEAVVSTLSILYGGGEESLLSAISSHFTPLVAYAYMVFVLLYTPCLSAIAVMQREFNSMKWTVFALVSQTGLAWVIAFMIYQIGSMFI